MQSQTNTKLNVGTGATTTNASNSIELNKQFIRTYCRDLGHHQPAINSIKLNVGTGPTTNTASNAIEINLNAGATTKLKAIQ